METITLVIAIWGAVISTALAISKLFSYLRRGKPRLRLEVTPLFIPDDDKTIKCFKLSLKNIGTVTTTIVAFWYVKYNSGRFWRGLGLFNPFPNVLTGVALSDGKPELPYRLEPGGFLRYTITLRPDIEEWLSSGRVYVAVEDSYHNWLSSGSRERLYRSFDHLIEESWTLRESKKKK